jgi:hypothetical protein
MGPDKGGGPVKEAPVEGPAATRDHAQHTASGAGTHDYVLVRVAEYRAAARQIVEADHASVIRRCLKLVELASRAREETDDTVRAWAERSIWEESNAFLSIDDDQPIPLPSYEAAQRQLRLRGYESCPTCRARIATEDELARWSRLRTGIAEQRRIRREAVR